jgi:hypothetical protein
MPRSGRGDIFDIFLTGMVLADAEPPRRARRRRVRIPERPPAHR